MDELERLTSNGCGIGDKNGMLLAINKAESKQIKDISEEYLLGIAYRNFSAWHCRADDELPYMKKSVDHFKNVLLFNNETYIVLAEYELIMILIKNIRVRDYETAEKLAKDLMQRSQDYLPCLCSYCDMLYSQKRYDECYKLLVELRERAMHDEECAKYQEPPYIQKKMIQVLKKITSK